MPARSRPVAASFNPRPPRGGRPALVPHAAPLQDVSIRAPRAEGDVRRPQTCTPRASFNPRPPRGGRHGDGDRLEMIWTFQSAPPARRATGVERLAHG